MKSHLVGFVTSEGWRISAHCSVDLSRTGDVIKFDKIHTQKETQPFLSVKKITKRKHYFIRESGLTYGDLEQNETEG